MGNEFKLLSGDAQIKLHSFVEDFALAFAQEIAPAEDWARSLGLNLTTDAAPTKTKFPIPVHAAGYKKFEGDVRYRSLFEKSFDLTPETWQDGVSELASIIEAPDFIGWAMQPEAMGAQARALPNQILATLLEANAVHPLDGLTFFNASHPVNVLDSSLSTFANTFTGAGTAASITALETAKTNMRKVKAANGQPAGFRLTHVMCHPDKEETWRGLLERDLIIESNGANNFGTVRNRHQNTVQLVVCDTLTVSAQWYAISTNKPGAYPWVVMEQATPETNILDRNSFLYQSQLKLGINSILRANAGLALPHVVHRYVGA